MNCVWVCVCVTVRTYVLGNFYFRSIEFRLFLSLDSGHWIAFLLQFSVGNRLYNTDSFDNFISNVPFHTANNTIFAYEMLRKNGWKTSKSFIDWSRTMTKCKNDVALEKLTKKWLRNIFFFFLKAWYGGKMFVLCVFAFTTMWMSQCLNKKNKTNTHCFTWGREQISDISARKGDGKSNCGILGNRKIEKKVGKREREIERGWWVEKEEQLRMNRLQITIKIWEYLFKSLPPWLFISISFPHNSNFYKTRMNVNFPPKTIHAEKKTHPKRTAIAIYDRVIKLLYQTVNA